MHPVAKLVLVLAVLVASLALSHPAYLVALLVGTIALAVSARVPRDWWAFMRLFLIVALIVVAINAVVSPNGSTFLWRGPYIPLFGTLSVSVEGIVFGSVMALRLFTVVSAFTVLSLTIHPDEFTQLLARVAYRSGLAVSLSTRFYPAVVRDATAIVDAQRSRGLDLDSGGRISRIRRRIPVVMPLFHNSLERAVGTAEAMEARGFGGHGRTRWRRRGWILADGVAIGMAIGILVLTAALSLFSDGAPTYYPRVELETGAVTLVAAVAMALMVAAPGATPDRDADGGGPHG
jgi:energy-coupling factor transport system permease protein